MTEIGKTEYRRLALAAHWLDDLDRNDLLIYAANFERVRRIQLSSDFQRDVLVRVSADGSKKFVINPLLKIHRDCSAEMRAISLKLGLATIDRLKLAAPPVEEKQNKWVKFFEGG